MKRKILKYLGIDNMRRGWWKINFKFWVEGKDDVFDLEDLSEISQEHIIDSIKQGYTSGELNEPDIQSDTKEQIQREEDRSKRSSKSDV